MALVNTNFDFSALPSFWGIFDSLCSDATPSPEAWQGLFSSPGYRALIDHEFSTEFFIENFTLAFRPSKREELREALVGSRKGYLRHYLRIRDERDKIENQLRWLMQTPLDDAARQMAMQWLPESVAGAPPKVHFVIFGPDARGFSSVVVDVAFTLQLEDIAASLAHEYHHVYRQRLVERLAKVPDDVSDIVWVLNQLQLEGIADQIDKRNWPDAAPTSGPLADYAKRYGQHFLSSPATLQGLSDSLEECASHPDRRQEVGKCIRAAIPLAGHPTGAFMVRTIEEAFDRNACIETFENPFEFLRLYSMAAARTQKAPPLTTVALQSIAAIDELCSTS